MRIEIGAGGISTCSSVYDYQLNMYSFADRVDDVLSCFKMIKAETENLNGGVGNLHEAVNEVSDVIDENSQRQADVKSVRSKTNSFLDLAIRVDQQVAVKVMQNREQFYRVHEWLRPNPPEEEKSFLGQMWDWLCGVGEAVVEGIKEGWNWITDTAKKIWDGLVAFYEENKKIIDTILIAAGTVLAVAAVVCTGGLALAPLLSSIGLSTAAAAFLSSAVGVIAVVSTVGASTLNLIDTWCEIDDPIFNAFQGGLNIVSGITNLVYNIGTIYNSIKHINPKDFYNNSGKDVVEIKLPQDKYPESAKHIQDAIKEGQPDTLTLDRGGAAVRRNASLDGVDTIPGLDRDEYPFAMAREGGKGASVRHIDFADNRGAGSYISHQLRGYPDGTRFRITITGGN